MPLGPVAQTRARCMRRMYPGPGCASLRFASREARLVKRSGISAILISLVTSLASSQEPTQFCRRSVADTGGWRATTAAIAPIRFLLPAGYREWNPTQRVHFSTDAQHPVPPTLPVAVEFFNSPGRDRDISLERFEWAADSAAPPWLTDQRATEVSECSDSVDGRRFRVRSYRAPGMILHGERELNGYVVEAALDLAPNVRLVMTCMCASPEGQREALQVIYSLRVISQ